MKHSRTKESLIAQQQAYQKSKGEKKAGPEFSFTKFPPAATLRVCIMLLVLGLGLIALPAFLPDFGKQLYRDKAVQSVSQFELTNELFKGQFKATPHTGDTRPDREATFLAVSILTSHPNAARIKHEDKTQQYVNQLEAADFNKGTEEIYQGIVQLKGLGLLKEGSVSKQYTDKYYNMLLSLTERHSAFRLNALRSASISATYFAFQAIKELGKMDQFKQLEAFNSAVHFVASMKDPTTGGFRDSTGENATLLATWHAVQVLAEKDTRSGLVTKTYEGVDKFVFSCQAKDGGFLNEPIDNLQDLYFSHSKMVSTSQGIYILEFLAKNNMLLVSFTDASASYFDAINYLRACLSWKHGVLGSYPSDTTDLQATYYFLRLINAFPDVVYGTPRSLQIVTVAVGVVLFLISIYVFYQPQLSKGAVTAFKRELRTSLLFLALAAVALQTCPALSIAVYLCFAIHLAIQLYEVVSADNSDGVMPFVAAVNTCSFLGLIFVFLYVAPLIFTNVRVFYILAGWGACTTVIVTLVSCYMTGVKKLFFYINAGFLAWILNTVLCHAFLYGRGEMAIVYRSIVVHGHFPTIFVVLPLVSLAFAYAFSAGAAAIYLQATRPDDEKPPSVAEMLKEDDKADLAQIED